MTRHQVHLSGEVDTGRRVGQRKGRPVILAVAAADLAATGEPFYCSELHRIHSGFLGESETGENMMGDKWAIK
ncbi:hypothetical protein PROH_09530 [Prochlorothrix hollandica PCC 9006 = CALU 1027]|uniref:Uncharacterized protein n=2 Tax=Prochlorothrix hollandica TaxID=1223 RepID=A0A0M2PV68_PROHO|nr:hypothetical protein PROH_09530 [Prochlorothrix hollandica PCC 9006 = CALU 1027]